jgi:hypothetical protein
MKDPDRLLSSGATEQERLLLSAGAVEQPPEDGAARVRALLGLSGAVLASGAVVASAHSLPPAAAANAVLTTGKTAAVGAALNVGGAKLALPWLVVVLTGAGVLGGIFVLAQNRAPLESQAKSAPLVETVSTPKPSEFAPDLVNQPVQTTDGSDREQVPNENEARAPVPVPVPTKNTAKLSLSIARETADLDAARVALREGSARRALKALDHYSHAHPRGVLRPEATVLRIEALLRSPDSAKGQRLGSDFLNAHPESPYAARVRSLLNDADRGR